MQEKGGLPILLGSKTLCHVALGVMLGFHSFGCTLECMISTFAAPYVGRSIFIVENGGGTWDWRPWSCARRPLVAYISD